jgi:hypothetical protein
MRADGDMTNDETSEPRDCGMLAAGKGKGNDE